LFWDTIHPTTKAHEMVAVEVEKNLSDTDDDDSCFISTASEGLHSFEHVAVLPGIFMIIGLAGLFLKKN